MNGIKSAVTYKNKIYFIHKGQNIIFSMDEMGNCEIFAEIEWTNSNACEGLVDLYVLESIMFAVSLSTIQIAVVDMVSNKISVVGTGEDKRSITSTFIDKKIYFLDINIFFCQ